MQGSLANCVQIRKSSFVKNLRLTAMFLISATVGALFTIAIVTTEQARWPFFNSDLLFAAFYTHDFLRDPSSFKWFLMPRVPSFFPDLFVTAVLSVVMPAWRTAALAYAVLSFVAMVMVGSLLVARIAAAPLLRCCVMFLAVAVIAMCADLMFNDAWGALFYIFFPTIHSGSLIAALFGLLLLQRYIERPTMAAALTIATLVALCTLSDRIFVFTFVLPAIVASGAVLAAQVRTDMRQVAVRAIRMSAIVGGGCLAGFVMDIIIFKHFLSRDPDVKIDLTLQLNRLPALLADGSVQFEIGCAATILILWFFRRRIYVSLFWWIASFVMVCGHLAILSLIFVDYTATRYAQPIWWWAVILAAAAMVQLGGRIGLTMAGGLATAFVAFVAATRPDFLAPRAVTAWADPDQRCMSALQAAGRIHAGIAQYWIARPLVASSDWTLQVVQVSDQGWIFPWENNMSDYGQSFADRAQKPVFDFLVLKRLDPAKMVMRFGTPSQVVACPSTEVWIYADKEQLRQNMVGLNSWAEPKHQLVSVSRIVPSELFDHVGPLPSSGLVHDVKTVSPSIATWGPYIRLHPGSWQAVMRYDLTGSAVVGNHLDVHLPEGGRLAAQGELEAGTDRVKTIAFNVPADATLVEIRTFIAQEQALRIRALLFMPITMTTDKRRR